MLQLLVELPHKDSDCVDLSGDTGAVGRFTFCNRVRSHQPERLSETAVPPSAAAVEGTGDEAGPSATAQVSSGDEGRDGEDDTEEALVLDLKGVKFDAKITALAGTACVVNIGPSGAKVRPDAPPAPWRPVHPHTPGCKAVRATAFPSR